jgi:hypothetical protein
VGTCLGTTSEQGNIVYIFPSVLNQALTKAGYSPRKTMKYMAERGLITATTDKSGKKVYTTVRRFGDRTCRFVEFFIGKISEARDPIDDDADESYEENTGTADQFPYQQSTMGEFTELTGGDDELPF